MSDLLLKMVDYADLPQWFQISFLRSSDSDPPAIVFALDHHCAELVHEYLAGHRYVELLKRHYKLASYEPDLIIGFGFDGAARPGKPNGLMIEVRFPLVKRKMEAIAASIFVLAQVLTWFPVRAAGSNRSQLMEIEPFLRPGEYIYAAPLSGKISPLMRRTLKGWYGRRDVTDVIAETMFAAWRALGGKVWGRKDRYDQMGFYARIEADGRFWFQCPGNSCDVGAYPDLNEPFDQRGLRFGCHNLDSMLQQLTLLAGLTRLHDLVTQELENRS